MCLLQMGLLLGLLKSMDADFQRAKRTDFDQHVQHVKKWLS